MYVLMRIHLGKLSTNDQPDGGRQLVAWKEVKIMAIVKQTRMWAILDSNQGPQSYQDCALTS